jgi:hypothetical protein
MIDKGFYRQNFQGGGADLGWCIRKGYWKRNGTSLVAEQGSGEKGGSSNRL